MPNEQIKPSLTQDDEDDCDDDDDDDDDDGDDDDDDNDSDDDYENNDNDDDGDDDDGDKISMRIIMGNMVWQLDIIKASEATISVCLLSTVKLGRKSTVKGRSVHYQ